MTLRPHRLALILALATIAGLVGLMLLDNGWQAPCFALAATPAALGACSVLRSSRRSRR